LTFQAHDTNENKKSELMLMRRATAHTRPRSTGISSRSGTKLPH